MTDQERLITLLDEWDVPHEEEDIPSQPGECPAVSVNIGRVRNLRESSKVTGYGGFFTSFEFDLDGKFVRVGAWE